ncbi:AraC family transcriptional regulator [Bradyrhizobium sp. 18BD]
MDTDPLSDILRLANVTALLTGGFTAGGPWAIRFPARERIQFFAVVKGRCCGQFDGEDQSIWFENGDIGLLVEPHSVVLASDPDVAPVKGEDLFAGGRTMATIGDGSEFAYIAGHVDFDQAGRRLLADVLPIWIHVRPKPSTAMIFRWLLDRIVEEQAAGLPGSKIASAQLMQLLFIEILRAHLETRDVMPAGWLRVMADPHLAPALRLMHGEPSRSWHLEELARAAAMSRTTFAERFRAVAGVAPLTYLTEWRMRLAERALHEERTPVAAIARSLGYGSESAFSNAFKRVTGQSPRACRDAARRSGLTTAP